MIDGADRHQHLFIVRLWRKAALRSQVKRFVFQLMQIADMRLSGITP